MLLKAAGALLAMPAIVTGARAEARSIVVRDLGLGTSFMDAYGSAFTKATT